MREAQKMQVWYLGQRDQRKILWRRKCQPTPEFLPEKFHEERSLAAYGTRGHKESDMTEHIRMHKYNKVSQSKKQDWYTKQASKKTWLFHGESLPRGILPSFQITTLLFFYLASRVSF